MPPTVKSLEERIDEMASEFEEVARQGVATAAKVDAVNAKVDAVNAKVDGVVAAQNTTNVQLAVLISKLDAVIEQSKVTNAKVDAMSTDYAAHKSKADTTFALTKWIGAFVAGVFLTILVGSFTVVRSAGSLETTVQQQQKTLGEIKHDLNEIRAKQK